MPNNTVTNDIICRMNSTLGLDDKYLIERIYRCLLSITSLYGRSYFKLKLFADTSIINNVSRSISC